MTKEDIFAGIGLVGLCIAGYILLAILEAMAV
jgi:hypothetical protein